MLDYSDRRPVNSNRPRRQGIAVFVVASALAGAVVGYFLGLASGWMIYKPARQEMNKLRREVEDATARVKELETSQVKPEQPPAAGVKTPEPPLTFYNDLKSNSTVWGTGVNRLKETPPPANSTTPKPAASPSPAPPAKGTTPSTAPAADEARQPHSAPSAAAPAKPGEAAVSKPQAGGKYAVQIASYQSRSEAESVRKRLMDNGLPAYIVESAIPDKGTWYRVRVGKHLDPAAATELLGRAGKGAIIIAE